MDARLRFRLRTNTADPARPPGRTAEDVPTSGGPGPAKGFATATIDLPRHAGAEQARADLLQPLGSGEPVCDEIIDRLVLPPLEMAVPLWRAVLDAILALSEIGGPVGLSGGAFAFGIRLAAVEPRIAAARLFAGTSVPRTMVAEARQITIPLLVLLQWDDEGSDRQRALDLFDAFGSKEKALHANTGGHNGIPASEADEGNRFFARHLE